jgi:hypothetical protein
MSASIRDEDSTVRRPADSILPQPLSPSDWRNVEPADLPSPPVPDQPVTRLHPPPEREQRGNAEALHRRRQDRGAVTAASPRRAGGDAVATVAQTDHTDQAREAGGDWAADADWAPPSRPVRAEIQRGTQAEQHDVQATPDEPWRTPVPPPTPDIVQIYPAGGDLDGEASAFWTRRRLRRWQTGLLR